MSATDNSKPLLSVDLLFDERDARRQRERAAAEELKRHTAEELTAYKKRLDEFQLTDAHREMVVHRIKGAFERGETEIMLVAFPSSMCTDAGRAVNNADVPPIVKPKPEEAAAAADRHPEWLSTLPRGAVPIYQFWKRELKPGGFTFSARIINYPGGMPGDVGLFFSWPKSAPDRAVSGA
jgi:hypothetical protein